MALAIESWKNTLTFLEFLSPTYSMPYVEQKQPLSMKTSRHNTNSQVETGFQHQQAFKTNFAYPCFILTGWGLHSWKAHYPCCFEDNRSISVWWYPLFIRNPGTYLDGAFLGQGNRWNRKHCQSCPIWLPQGFWPQRPSYPSKEGLFLIHASLCQALGDRISHEQTTAFATRDKRSSTTLSTTLEIHWWHHHFWSRA